MTCDTDTVQYVTGDTGPRLTGTCTTTGGLGANLTGATLAVHLRRPDKTTLTKTATILDATAGTWQAADWAPGDLDAPGWWRAEVQVTYSDGQIQTFPAGTPARFVVRAEIA